MLLINLRFLLFLTSYTDPGINPTVEEEEARQLILEWCPEAPGSSRLLSDDRGPLPVLSRWPPESSHFIK